MINLEDISTDNIFNYLMYTTEKNSELLKIFQDYNINNCQQLKVIIDDLKDNSDVDLTFLSNYLLDAIEGLKLINESLEQPYVCYFDKYNNTEIDTLSLEKTDRETLAKRLIYMNPTRSFSSPKIEELNRLSIHQTKYLLGKLYVSSCPKEIKNALVFNTRNMGGKEVFKIKKLIDFYEEQVIRQAQESGLKDVNYFDLNALEKESIIIDNYKEIMEYLIANADTCIWGTVSNRQKKIMLHSINGKGDYRIVKNNFINIFRDYTTLSELEDGKIKVKTLNRFIIK